MDADLTRPSDAKKATSNPGQTGTHRFGLSTLEDVTNIILQSEDLLETLQNIVNRVSDRMQSEVCSVYLVEGDRISLKASKGLAASSVGNTSLAIGEGLIGYTAEIGDVVNLRDPECHPKFRFVSGSNEERLHSFLGIPLYDRTNLLGVMAIQTVTARKFSETEVSTLRTIAFQLSSVIANARLLDSIHEQSSLIPNASQIKPGEENPGFLTGSSVGTGVCAAPAFLYQKAMRKKEGETTAVYSDLDEREKLQTAIEQAKIDTLCLQRLVSDQLSDKEGEIFQAHLMILQDRHFLEKLEEKIAAGSSANHAVRTVIADYRAAFERIRDPYLRARSVDIKDVGKRIQFALTGVVSDSPIIEEPSIVVASDLLPSQLAILPFDKIRGFVLESENSNGHTAILAKSMGLPTLFDVTNATRLIQHGDDLILDANSRRVYLRPDPQIMDEYTRVISEQESSEENLHALNHLPATTRDNQSITLRANVGLFSDLQSAKKFKAEGIGLYRTEFPFMVRSEFPDRQEQYSLYRRVLETFPDHPVTFRTLDIGGDKTLPYFSNPEEANPFLGWRSIRVSLDHPEIFQTQIEAILMAAPAGNAKLMFPMIISVEEFNQCLAIVENAKRRLDNQGIEYADVPIGVMIETPATVAIAKYLGENADFFSIGTNDLVQYMVGADRGNSRVSEQYQPLHPGVLGAIQTMVEVASATRCSLSMCGEMVNDFRILAMLTGMGVKEFSVSAPLIPALKRDLRDYELKTLEGLADEALQQVSEETVRGLLKDFFDD